MAEINKERLHIEIIEFVLQFGENEGIYQGRQCLERSKVSLPLFPFLCSSTDPLWLWSELTLNPNAGVLVECDPSIKAIILKIDQPNHDYIIEDLDDQTLVIKESQLQKLKARLEEVSLYTFNFMLPNP